jgi:hypothetical protein
MGTSIFFAEEDSAMNWTTLNFFKHRGKTLPQIIFDDADWFFNGWENGYFKNSLAFEAREIYRRARSISLLSVKLNAKRHQNITCSHGRQPASG